MRARKGLLYGTGFFEDGRREAKDGEEEKGLSLEKLAEEVMFASRQSLGKYENGVQAIPLETLVAVCKVLEIRPDQVLGVERSIDKERWMKLVLKHAEEMYEELNK